MTNKENDLQSRILPQIQPRYLNPKLFNAQDFDLYTLNYQPILQERQENRGRNPPSGYKEITLNEITRKLDYNLITQDEEQRQMSRFNQQKAEIDTLKREIRRMSEELSHERGKQQQQLNYYVGLANQNKQQYLRLEFRSKELEFENSTLKQQLQECSSRDSEEGNWRKTKYEEFHSKIRELTERNQQLAETVFSQKNQIVQAKARFDTEINKYNACTQKFQDLKKQKSQLEDQLRQIKRESASSNQNYQIRIKQAQHKHDLREKQLQGELENARRTSDYLKHQLQSSQSQKQSLRLQINELKQSIAIGKEQNNTQIKKMQMQLRRKENQLEEQKGKGSVETKKVETELKMVKIELENMMKSIQLKDRTINDLTQNIESMKRKILDEVEISQNGKTEIIRQMDRLKKEKCAVQEELREALVTSQEISDRYECLQQKWNNTMQSLEDLDRQNGDLKEMLSQIQHKYYRLESQLETSIKNLRILEQEKFRLMEQMNKEQTKSENIGVELQHMKNENNLIRQDNAHLMKKYQDLDENYLKLLRGIKGFQQNSPVEIQYHSGESELTRKINQKSTQRMNTCRPSLVNQPYATTTIHEFTTRDSPRSRPSLRQRSVSNKNIVYKMDEKEKLNQVILKRCKLILGNQGR